MKLVKLGERFRFHFESANDRQTGDEGDGLTVPRASAHQIAPFEHINTVFGGKEANQSQKSGKNW